MFIDFSLIPPEINATRLYTGPGSAPMLAAATAWHAMAAELGSAAAKYQAEIGALSNVWQGVAGQRMAAAATRNVQWLTTTAAQAEQAGAQAAGQAVAYETARAATTPPPAIYANRSLQMTLINTNFLGQNTPAIMANETLYLEMWAQCAAAMFSYSAATEQSSALTSYTQPGQTTDDSGFGRQAAALSKTVATDTAGKTSDSLTNAGLAGGQSGTLSKSITDGVKEVLQDPIKSLTEMYSGYKPTDALNDTLEPMYRIAGITASSAGFLKTVAPATAAAKAAVPGMLGAVSGANGMMLTPGTVGSALAANTAPVSASLANATRLAGMSMPASWTSATAALGNSAATLPAANLASSISTGATTPGHMVGGLPLSGAGAAGRGIGDGVLRVGPRPFVMPRPLSAG